MVWNDPRSGGASALPKTAFRLNGQFLAIGEELARPAGLTAAWWLVLSTVLDRPLTVAEVAREIGVTRQSVQRIADVIVDRGLAGYRPIPLIAELSSCRPRRMDALRFDGSRRRTERSPGDWPPSTPRRAWSELSRPQHGSHNRSPCSRQPTTSAPQADGSVTGATWGPCALLAALKRPEELDSLFL